MVLNYKHINNVNRKRLMADLIDIQDRKLKQIIGGVVVVVLIITGVILLARPHNQSTVTNGTLTVVAAENFWGNIASQIGGNHVHVTSIITDPNADPHLYESNAQDASDVASAKVVIVNGVGYDDFMSKLLSASKNSNRQVISAAQILGITSDGANPHLWYDIPRVNLVASQIADGFEAKDPSHKSDYQHNLTTFDQSLQPLLQTINQIKQQYGGTPVAYTEPVPGYLLNAAGLTVKTPEGFAKSIEDGDDPSPADTLGMDNLMTKKQVKVLLYNAQTTSPVTQHARDLANQAGIPVIGVTETLPANEHSYQSWQRDQLDELLKALQS
jgi:zinc/manganese transport system substrate-binding protein